jgi:serine protease AprX
MMDIPLWINKLSPLLKQIHSQKEPAANSKIIIEHTGRKTDRLFSLLASGQGKVNLELKLIPSLAVELSHVSLEEIARSRWVKKIWYDAPVRVCLDVAVPAIGGGYVQKKGGTGEGVVVAVIDTGIFPHNDLINPANRIIAWNDLVGKENSPYDDNGHGTHVAGIIAGNGGLSRGRFTGIAPQALLVGVKALDKTGAGEVSTVISGIEWCLKQRSALNIKIINLSLGTTAQESYRTDPLCRALSSAWREGVVVCAAAGNEGPDRRTITSPGINPLIITVGNINDQQTLAVRDDQINPSSGRGPTIDNIVKPDLLAPGTQITSLWNKKDYRTLTGTSMATPLVSGAVALILQKWPSLRPEQVKQTLKKNAHDLGLNPNLQGAGIIDLEKIFTREIKNSNLAKINQLSPHFYQILSCQIIKKVFQKSDFSSLWEELERISQDSIINLINEIKKI